MLRDCKYVLFIFIDNLGLDMTDNLVIHYLLLISSSPNEFLQADSGKHGDSDSSVLRSSEEEINDDGFLGLVPDSSMTVPQIPSPPTASGLYWPKDPRYTSDNAMSVPDICFSHVGQPHRVQNNSTLSKRRRQQ